MNRNAPFDKLMIVRTIVLIVALINQLLVNAGYSPLPFDDASTEIAVTTTLTVAAAIWAWWKDNDITRQARLQKKKEAK